MVELYATFCLDTKAKKWKFKLNKYLISSCGDRTDNQSRLQSLFVPLCHEWPLFKMLALYIHFFSNKSTLEEMTYVLKFLFPFLRSGIQAKRGVEFYHLPRNASRIRQKVGNGVYFPRFPLPTLLCAGYSVKLIKDHLSYTSCIIKKNSTKIIKSLMRQLL